MKMRRYLPLPMLLVSAAACQNHATTPTPALIGSAHALDIGLDPEGAGSVQVLGFEVDGLVDGRWVGSWFDSGTGAEGSLEVAPASFEPRGETVRLAQAWVLFPPDPVIPPDPVFPPDPIEFPLVGILNLLSGELVLNLHPPDPIHPPDPVHPPDPISPHRVHVRGTATTGDGGLTSVIGELMFNPQPEPPGLF
jgi:hypothetical protein